MITDRIGRSLGRALMDEGLVPEHCSVMDVSIPAGSAPTITYRVFITEDHLSQFARAMQRVVLERRSLMPDPADMPGDKRPEREPHPKPEPHPEPEPEPEPVPPGKVA